jgi:hypothetical protein
VLVPAHPAKHLNVAPSEAQSPSTVQVFEQALPDDVHPASLKVGRSRHDKPDSQSLFVEQAALAPRAEVPQAATPTKITMVGMVTSRVRAGKFLPVVALSA